MKACKMKRRDCTPVELFSGSLVDNGLGSVVIEEDGALPGVDLNLAAKIREAPHVRLNVVEKDNSNKFSNVRITRLNCETMTAITLDKTHEV